MSLRTTYSDDNLVIDSGLTVTYSKSLISGNWGYTSANVSGYYNYMWELRRVAKQSFRYVGMTQAAAYACRDAMVAKYTRDFRISIWDSTSMGGGWHDEGAGSMPMAEVAPSHNDDGSYDVIVNVNEDDKRMRKVGDPIYFPSAFAYERQRVYEGDETEEGSGGI